MEQFLLPVLAFPAPWPVNGVYATKLPTESTSSLPKITGSTIWQPPMVRNEQMQAAGGRGGRYCSLHVLVLSLCDFNGRSTYTLHPGFSFLSSFFFNLLLTVASGHWCFLAVHKGHVLDLLRTLFESVHAFLLIQGRFEAYQNTCMSSGSRKRWNFRVFKSNFLNQWPLFQVSARSCRIRWYQKLKFITKAIDMAVRLRNAHKHLTHDMACAGIVRGRFHK